jgi:hypothetical protein
VINGWSSERGKREGTEFGLTIRMGHFQIVDAENQSLYGTEVNVHVFIFDRIATKITGEEVSLN